MPTELHTFEFSLYNDHVRKLIQSGESHRQLDDGWAEQRYVQIRAQNETRATQEMHRRYPEDKGYVYTSMTALET